MAGSPQIAADAMPMGVARPPAPGTKMKSATTSPIRAFVPEGWTKPERGYPCCSKHRSGSPITVSGQSDEPTPLGRTLWDRDSSTGQSDTQGISKRLDIAPAAFKFVPTENQNQIVIDFCQDARCCSLTGFQDRRVPFIQMHHIEWNRESFTQFAPFGFRLDSTMSDVTQRAVTPPCELQDCVAQLSDQPAIGFVDTHQSLKIAHGPHCVRPEKGYRCASNQ